MSLQGAVESKEILVVCGAGGVGKTSVSAALALAAARERRTIVLTIDPAKRLASALGLDGGIGHDVTKVDLPGGGRLWAAMLDMKTAWDELVDRYAPSRDIVESIRSNALYQGLSEHFVGSQGYMAMERLAQLHARGDFDLIVIDTPPTRHALDFLEAPKRMTDFVGGSLLRWFARPYAAAGKVGARAFSFTASPVLKIADRLLGSQVLEDLSRFVMDFQTMYDGFKERATEVLRLLHQPSTGFVVVTTLEGPPLEEAGFFLDRLSDERLPLSGVVANRVMPPEFASDESRAALDVLREPDWAAVARATSLDPDEVRAALLEARDCLLVVSDTAKREAERAADLKRRARAPITRVPLMTGGVYDLATLEALAEQLTTAQAPAS